MKSLENKHNTNESWSEKVEDKYTFLSDNFIFEKQPIGKTEQLSSSEKPNNLNSGMSEKPNNHIKIRYCCICGKQTDGGSVCQSDDCFDKFEKL